MSQANLAVVKQALDAFNRRDLDTYDDLYTPDFEWFPAMAGIVEGGGYKGRKGMTTFLAEVRDTWEEFSVLTDEFRDIGNRVLVLCRIEGRGRGSGVQVDAPGGMVFEFHAGKMSRGRGYLGYAEALRAAGLTE
jgi:ketosteroid isomerase-like protein